MLVNPCSKQRAQGRSAGSLTPQGLRRQLWENYDEVAESNHVRFVIKYTQRREIRLCIEGVAEKLSPPLIVRKKSRIGEHFWRWGGKNQPSRNSENTLCPYNLLPIIQLMSSVINIRWPRLNLLPSFSCDSVWADSPLLWRKGTKTMQVSAGSCIQESLEFLIQYFTLILESHTWLSPEFLLAAGRPQGPTLGVEALFRRGFIDICMQENHREAGGRGEHPACCGSFGQQSSSAPSNSDNQEGGEALEGSFLLGLLEFLVNNS